jgi:uncharacterized protein YydD (DUF2326 family)
MQLSRIYSNRPDMFEPIDFNHGQDADLLNVILGDVRHPKDHKRDSHNLGKTTLLNLIDFLMLKGASSDLFLVKHRDHFAGFVFFIEITLNGGGFATVRRSADNPSRIGLTRHRQGGRDYVNSPDDAWDHPDMSHEDAVALLDGWLDLQVLKPYDYRKGITYFLRAQGDFQDELQLKKFQQGKDLYWKPFVAHLFGLDQEPIRRKYQLDDEIKKLKERKAELQAKVQFSENDLPELAARISVIEQQVNTLEEQLDAFRFDAEEHRIMRELVNGIEIETAELNERLYNIRYDIQQIDVAFEHKDKFDLREVDTIFEECNVHFPDQLKKQYADLVAFNKKVTQERNTALRARRKALEEEQQQLSARKKELDETRAAQLRVLRNTDTFDKFKALQNDLTKQRAHLVYLQEQRKQLEQVAEMARQIGKSDRERGRTVDDIKAMVSKPSPVFKKFTRIFNDYCRRVLNQDGMFCFYVNANNNFDYKIGLSLTGQTNKPSSQGEGTSYKKLVCALFDLALLKVYEDAPFFHFVYHDGILEGLDDRKKRKLLEVIREQIASRKTQYIMTLIASDLPRDARGEIIYFQDREIVLQLHDEGVEGRLFKMERF